MDAQDRLTALLLVTRRKTGIAIDDRRFRGEGELWALIRDVREDVQALEGQLAACEDMARHGKGRAE
jgi:hypothetical protein